MNSRRILASGLTTLAIYWIAAGNTQAAPQWSVTIPQSGATVDTRNGVYNQVQVSVTYLPSDIPDNHHGAAASFIVTYVDGAGTQNKDAYPTTLENDSYIYHNPGDPPGRTTYYMSMGGLYTVDFYTNTGTTTGKLRITALDGLQQFLFGTEVPITPRH